MYISRKEKKGKKRKEREIFLITMGVVSMFSTYEYL